MNRQLVVSTQTGSMTHLLGEDGKTLCGMAVSALETERPWLNCSACYVRTPGGFAAYQRNKARP